MATLKILRQIFVFCFIFFLSCADVFSKSFDSQNLSPVHYGYSVPVKNLRAARWTRTSDTEVKKKYRLVTFRGETYAVDPQHSLSILATEACNAKCGFCVKQVREIACAYKKRVPLSFFENLDLLLSTFIDKDNFISVTGGEPLLLANLKDIFAALTRHTRRKHLLSTNGVYLMKKLPGKDKTVLEALIENGLKALVISRVHNDEKVNAEVMRYRYFPKGMKDLKDAIALAQEAGINVTLSVILLREGICDMEALREYLKWASQLGVKNVQVKELFQFDPSVTGVNDQVRYTVEQFVPIDEILSGVDEDPLFRFQKQESSQDYYRETYSYKGMNVSFYSYHLDSPYLIDGTDDEGHPVLRKLVIFPDGTVYNGWQQHTPLITAA